MKTSIDRDTFERLVREFRGSTVTVKQAADICGLSLRTVYQAIRDGRLQARIPLGLDPRRTGRLGYRITIEALRRWYFGPSDE